MSVNLESRLWSPGFFQKNEPNILRILSWVWFVRSLEESKTSRFAFEIYWPLVNKKILPEPWNVIMASDIWMGRLGEFDDNRIISRLWGPCNLSPKRARASKNWERIMSNYNNTKWPDLFKIVRKSRKVVYIAWIGINGQICWQVWHVFVTF